MSSENYFISEQLETGLARVKIKDMNMGIAPRLQKLSQWRVHQSVIAVFANQLLVL